MKTYKKLNFPEFEPKLKNENNQTFVLDHIRKKWLLLTPEEWVRQHLVNYLITIKNYPASLISLEAGLKYNSLQKRSDILVYSKSRKPFLLVECKSTDVIINQKVIDQVSVYNKSINATFLCVSNGLKHYCWTFNKMNSEFEILNQIPDYIET